MKRALYVVLFSLFLANIIVVEATLYRFVEAIHQDCLIPNTYTIHRLAGNNKSLQANCDRARVIVATVQEENTKLRASLNESARLLSEERAETNRLQDSNGRMKWKIKTLEDVIKQLSKEKVEQVKPCLFTEKKDEN